MALQHILTQAQINTLLTLNFALGTPLAVTGAVAAGGLVNLTVTAHGLVAANAFAPVWASVKLVTGTIEANGFWAVTIPDANHLTLIGSTFAVAYVSGGFVTQVSITGGAVANLTSDDAENIFGMTQRAVSAPSTPISVVLAIAP
jgi:hypothetical protein